MSEQKIEQTLKRRSPVTPEELFYAILFHDDPMLSFTMETCPSLFFEPISADFEFDNRWFKKGTKALQVMIWTGMLLEYDLEKIQGIEILKLEHDNSRIEYLPAKQQIYSNKIYIVCHEKSPSTTMYWLEKGKKPIYFTSNNRDLFVAMHPYKSEQAIDNFDHLALLIKMFSSRLPGIELALKRYISTWEQIIQIMRDHQVHGLETRITNANVDDLYWYREPFYGFHRVVRATAECTLAATRSNTEVLRKKIAQLNLELSVMPFCLLQQMDGQKEETNGGAYPLKMYRRLNWSGIIKEAAQYDSVHYGNPDAQYTLYYCGHGVLNLPKSYLQERRCFTADHFQTTQAALERLHSHCGDSSQKVILNRFKRASLGLLLSSIKDNGPAIAVAPENKSEPSAATQSSLVQHSSFRPAGNNPVEKSDLGLRLRHSRSHSNE